MGSISGKKRAATAGAETYPDSGQRQNPWKFSFDSKTPMVTVAEDQIQYCVEALEQLRNKRINSPETIRQEFMSLQLNRIRARDMRSRCTVALHDSNIPKNRYRDVLPFDENRVILKRCSDYRSSAQGYINASFIKTTESVNRFIATQGPVSHTMEDFWEMVLEYRCPAIVMVTCLVDSSRTEKCVDYFQAENGTREFGNICITTKQMHVTPSSLVLRCSEVKHKESKEPPLSVLHVQYPEWPDHGVPKDTVAVREIFRYLSDIPLTLGQSSYTAGIGRTGTYCLIHSTIQRILVGDMDALHLDTTVQSFRSQRIGMVQTFEQYLFCYDAIIDELGDMVLSGKASSSS